MVVTMSDARARKNAADREGGLKRLEKRFRTGRITKDKLNNRGYNRFLTMTGGRHGRDRLRQGRQGRAPGRLRGLHNKQHAHG